MDGLQSDFSVHFAPMPMHATSIDVAKLAGVSQSTVSRVFSLNANVSAEKTERVLAAARELGYKPNILARSLITQSTNLIGVVIADVGSLFYANFLSRLSERLREIGKQVLLFSVGVDQSADEVLPTLLQYQVDALIIAATTLSADMAADCAQTGTPVLVFNRFIELPQVNSFSVDHADGGRQIANLFLKGNHQRYGYITGIETTQSSQLREKGYRDQLAKAGVIDVLREVGNYSYEVAYDAATRLLRRADRPDAIFCASDQMAFATIDAARAVGLNVPVNLSVAGFDNVPQAAWTPYRLTTIAHPLDQMLDMTMKILEERLQGIQKDINKRVIGNLIVRDSVYQSA